MFKSTLIEILKSFSAKEMKEFSDMVNSPFFNKNENVKKLYDYIKKYHPQFESKNLDKRIIFKKVSRLNNYDDTFMRKIIFKLQKLTEIYLKNYHFEKENIKTAIGLARELFQRDITSLFEKRMGEIEKQIEMIKIKDLDYYPLKYEFENLKSNYADSYSSFNRNKSRKKYAESEYFTDQTEYLIISFLLTIFNRYTALFGEQIMYKFKYKFEFLEEILSYLEKSKLHERIPLLKINYHMLMLYKNMNDESYYNLKKALVEEIKNLAREILRDATSILSNYCIYRGYRQEGTFDNEHFEILKLKIDHKLCSIKEGGEFLHKVFYNIVSTALALGKIKWTEKFIEKYHNNIEVEFRNMEYNYSLSHLYFAKKEFEKSLEYLSNISSIATIDRKLNFKILTLVILYELDYQEQLLNTLDSFRHFLASNKLLSELRKDWSVNFINCLTQLIKQKNNPDKASLMLLKKNIEQTEYFPNRKWFFEKIKTLEDSIK
jgi:hypothetical protein